MGRFIFQPTMGIHGIIDICHIRHPGFIVYKEDKIFAGTDGGLYSSDNLGDSWSLEYGATFDTHGNVIDTKMFKDLVVYEQYLIASIMFNSIWISSNDGKDWQSFNEGLISDWTFYGLAVKGPYLWSLREAFGNAYRRPLTDLVTDISSKVLTLPSSYTLYQNYPNPFNPSTIIKFALPKPESVKIEIFNILGQKIETLFNKSMPAGYHEVKFTSYNLPSGVYLYQIQAGNWQAVKKMILLQ